MSFVDDVRLDAVFIYNDLSGPAVSAVVTPSDGSPLFSSNGFFKDHYFEANPAEWEADIGGPQGISVDMPTFTVAEASIDSLFQLVSVFQYGVKLFARSFAKGDAVSIRGKGEYLVHGDPARTVSGGLVVSLWRQ